MRTVILAGVTGVLLASAADVRAEVSVRTDRYGRYVTTQIHVTHTETRSDDGLWAYRGLAERGTQVLNPDGDRNGDLWPVIVESNLAPFHPWAVWSRFDGSGYQIAWSVWTGSAWTEIKSLHQHTPGDDLDPDIAFDPAGNPSVVWSREEGGVSHVYWSRFVKKGFTPPMAISETHEDGRYPQILSNDGRSMVVEYTGASGTVQRTVAFAVPGTITDDINPLDRHAGTTPVFTGKQNGAAEPQIDPRSRPQR
ncbi:MAG TPA: hypothetical protein VD788_12770 [Candidatus Polarisedimenticolaceae bacterium]|nr:hypothetical protein [Candidatus Polarisedimenticolaceae bacterium]